MSDLFRGQSMSEAYRFISAGTAHSFTFNFPPDMVRFNNLTKWGTTAALPVSVWFREETAAGDAYQSRVIVDNGATGNSNMLIEAANGFTVANTAAGMDSFQRLISGATAADPVVITTTVAHGYQTNQIVRITDLGSNMPTARGMNELNNNRYKITVLTATTFSLQDPVSGEDVDGSNFVAYVSGGRVNLETRVLQLNIPQQPPYQVTPYVPNPFIYDPAVSILTAGTAVMGADGDRFLIEVYKWGAMYNLGDLLV